MLRLVIAPDGPFPFLAGVLTSPFKTFEALRRKPTWIAPIVIAVMLSMIGNAFYYWRVNPDWEQRVRTRIEKHTQTTGETMTPDQIAQQVESAKMLGRVFILLPAVSIPVFCLGVAGFYLIAFGLVFLRVPSFKKILSVVAWSEAAIKTAGLAIVMIVLMAIDKERLNGLESTKLVHTNLELLLPVGISPAVKSLAASLDLFTMWFLVLVTIGLTAILGWEMQKIATWRIASLVFGIWVSWILIKAGVAFGFGY